LFCFGAMETFIKKITWKFKLQLGLWQWL
jgi:hypothetical protein